MNIDREFIAHAMINVHIGVAVWALTWGVVALWAPKGKPLHLKAGRYFYNAFLVVVATAIVLTLLHPYPFGTLLGFGALYMTLSGMRALKARPGMATRYDWALGGAGTLLGLLLLAWGVYDVIRGRFDFTPQMFVLGGAQFLCGLGDLRALRAGRNAFATRIPRHLARMTGAFTAAMLGFLTTAHWFALPELVLWLGPPALAMASVFWARRRWMPRRRAMTQETATA